jgi:hypothetical protein
MSKLAEAWEDPSPVSLYIAKEETIHEDRYFMIDHYTVNRKLGIIYCIGSLSKVNVLAI